jgi:hypothetical protein
MAENFNMKQFLAENKLGPYSKLNENPIYATGGDDDYDARGDAERTGTEFIKLSDPRNPRHKEWMRSKSSGGGNLIDKIATSISKFNQFYIKKYTYKKDPVERKAAKKALENAIENRLKSEIGIDKEAAKKDILDKILGPIHTQWAKYKTSTDNTVTENIDNEVPLTDEVKKAIDDQIANDKADGEFENLVDMGFYEEDFPLELIDLFPDEDYDNISQNVRDYIADAISGNSSIEEIDVRSFDYKDLPTKDYSPNQVKMQDIVDFVKQYPGITMKELALKAYGTGYNYGDDKEKVLQGAVYMIERAVNAGKIVKVKDIKVGNARLTFFTPEDYQEFLQKKKSMKLGNIAIKENEVNEALTDEIINRIEGLIDEKQLSIAMDTIGSIADNLESEGIDYSDFREYLNMLLKEKLG